MTPDTTVFAITNGIAILGVLYIVRSNRHRDEERERKRDQEQLWRDLQVELNRNETASFRRHTELQRQLADHHRILKYLARRLS